MKFELNKVYRARNGSQWKIISISPKRSEFDIDERRQCLLINKQQDNWITVSLLGKIDMDTEHSFDLIHLVGDNFTENLRNFEFECYIGEDINEPINPDSILDLNFGHMVCHPQRNKKDVNHLPKISKWAFTMKELPDD